MLIPVIPLSEKFQKECSLIFAGSNNSIALFSTVAAIKLNVSLRNLPFI